MLLFDSILTMNRLHGHRTKEKILLKVADITLISLVDEVLPNMEIQVLEKNLNLERMGIANQMRWWLTSIVNLTHSAINWGEIFHEGLYMYQLVS